MTVSATSEPALFAETTQIGRGFGQITAAPVLTCTMHTVLPVQISTAWRRADHQQETL